MGTIIGTSLDDTLSGTATADEMRGGLGNDLLMGNAGDDVLYGDAGNDILDGGQGTDTYVFGRGDGRDLIVSDGSVTSQNEQLVLGAGIGLADVDVGVLQGDLVLSLKGSRDGVRILGYFNQPAANRMTIRFASGATWDAAAIDRKLVATDDQLTGTSLGEVLDGGLGNDLILGNGGSDLLYGDAGNDLMDGGQGADVYVFGRGDGQDQVISGTDQKDLLVLGSGIGLADVEVIPQGSDLLLSLTGSSDSVRIVNYFGLQLEGRMAIRFANGATWDALTIEHKLTLSDDQLQGTSNADLLDGGLGNDVLMGNDGDDLLYGDAGNDFMDGGQGADAYVFGRGDGQDQVVSGQNDLLMLGSGIGLADVDVIAYQGDLLLSLKGSSDSVRVLGYFSQLPGARMAIRFADDITWDAAAVDRKLNPSDDDLQGTPEGDVLDGGLGNDIIMGNNGDDLLYGDAGKDFLDGGQGADTYVFGRGDGQDQVVAGWDSSAGLNDQLVLGAGIGVADVAVSLDQGDLMLRLKGSSDSVRVVNYFGPDPEARLVIRFADGASWDAAAIGRKLNASDDQLQGTAVGEALDGGLGNDIILGNGGDDLLYGDAGNDFMDGGQGSDTYVFGRGDGQDQVVSGLNPPSVQPDSLVFATGVSLADVDVSVYQGDLLLSLQGSHDSVRVVNYFGQPSGGRMAIRFANGAHWDAQAIDRKLNASDDQLQGTPFGDMLDGGLGNDVIMGNDGDDLLYGDAGNDLMDGGQGADVYAFGRGDGQDQVVSNWSSTPGQNDLLVLGAGIGLADVDVLVQQGDLVLSLQGSSDSVRILGYFSQPITNRLAVRFADGAIWDGFAIDRKLNPGDDLLQGTPNADALDGGLGNDVLMGYDGDDLLYGDAGNDFMDGGLGADTYVFGRGDGQDQLLASPGSLAGQNDQLLLGVGISLADLDVTMAQGDVLLSVRDSSDSVRIVNYFGQPVDSRMAIRFADGAVWDAPAIDRKVNATDDTLQGSPNADALDGGLGNDSLLGNEGDDLLYGDAGNDTLIGGKGADTLIGGKGDDIYDVDNALDVIVEKSGGGEADEVHATVTYTAPDQVEILSLMGRADINAFANNQGMEVYGNIGNNRLVGGAGDDWLQDFAGNDSLEGGAGNDDLYGGAGVDSLYGNEGNDYLNGEAGIDVMVGGNGDDIYQVDNSADVINELAGGGEADEVRSWVSYTASDNLEILSLIGTGNTNAFANNQGMEVYGTKGNNHIVGGKGDDWLQDFGGNDSVEGGAGDDIIYGGTGNDTLYGNDGNDYLNGGDGADAMFGGKDNDTYIVDNVLDTVTENAGEGTDTVVISGVASYALTSNIEEGTLSVLSKAGASLMGNELGNVLTGSNFNDTLAGAGGNDTLIDTSTTSNDVYAWGRGLGIDTLTDAGGTDRLDVLAGVAANQVWLRKVNNNLELSVIGSGDSFTINNWYASAANQVESVKLSDGKTLAASKVQGLVDAMAAFTPPAAGQTTLPANYQTALNNVIASSWV